MSTSPTSWVPATLEERQQYDWFVANFEREAAIIVSWPGCTLDDPRLDRLADALESRPDFDELFERVLSGRTVLEELTTDPLALDRREAIDRLRGFVIGPDGETTCLVAILTQRGNELRADAVEAVRREAEAAGVSRDEQRMSGAPVESVTIDEESGRTLYHFAIPSAIVSLGLCWYCLRSCRYTMAIVIAAGLGECITLALVYYTGTPMNAMLIVMPPLIFVLTVSSGIHLTNYYYEAARDGDLHAAVARAVAIGILPCALAVATTMIGIGSLAVSTVAPVRQFGIFAPLGLLATVCVLFLILPGTIEWMPKPPRSAERAESRRLRQREVGRDAALWDRLWRLVARNANLVAVVGVGLMLAAGAGLYPWRVMGHGPAGLKTSVEVRALFSPASRFLRDYNWLDEHVAPLVPVEVLVRIDDKMDLNTLERMELVRDTAAAIKSIPRVEGVMTAATYTVDFPPRGGLRNVFARRAMNNRLRDHLGYFQDARFLYEEDGQQWWRISVRLRPGEEADYAKYLRELREHVEPVLRAGRVRLRKTEGIEAVYTGAMPLADRVHRMLLSDLYTSFFTAALLVAAVMILVLRSVGAGLLAMIPNVFPMTVLFGTMGWLSFPVDIGSMMTASIALGIAVDDTLHFLTWFRRETNEGAAPVEAVRRCYRHCGRAMVQTSLVCGLGLAVFVFSGFLPTQRFCAMILVLMLASLVGDLVLLPALLTGPLGRLFLRRNALSAPPQTPVRRTT